MPLTVRVNCAPPEFAEVGENCIVGPNATVLANARVADDSSIEAGALVGEEVREEATD